jgi:ribosome-associated translation inhibitor RaiA
MQIQVNTDTNIEGHEALAAQVRATVEQALRHVVEHITRVEVHLSDQDGPTRGNQAGQSDKRCVMEARLQGRQPIAATDQAATVDQAVQGAADKLSRMIDSAIGRTSKDDRASRHA